MIDNNNYVTRPTVKPDVTTKGKKNVRASRIREHKMRISDQSNEMHFEPDTFSTSLLTMCKPDWVPPGLFFEVTDSLRGFTEDMALIIADDIIDAWSGLGLHVTGYRHIDDLLGHLYTKILACAFKKGIKLEYHNKKGV